MNVLVTRRFTFAFIGIETTSPRFVLKKSWSPFSWRHWHQVEGPVLLPDPCEPKTSSVRER